LTTCIGDDIFRLKYWSVRGLRKTGSQQSGELFV
jgi:hypothetical protein